MNTNRQNNYTNSIGSDLVLKLINSCENRLKQGIYAMVGELAKTACLIGAATNEEPRELDIPLASLGAGDFNALIIEDGADSDYRTQRESYKVSRREVKATDVLHVKLAPGGGACVLLKKR